MFGNIQLVGDQVDRSLDIQMPFSNNWVTIKRFLAFVGHGDHVDLVMVLSPSGAASSSTLLAKVSGDCPLHLLWRREEFDHELVERCSDVRV